MKNRKKLTKFAKSLFRLSLTNFAIDRQKVHRIIKSLSARKIAHLEYILKIYKRLIEAKLHQEELIIETAEKIILTKLQEQELKDKTQALRIKYRQNPKITLGAKIIHGDWVYDATLTAKLKQLTRI